MATTKTSIKQADPLKLAKLLYNNLPDSTRSLLPEVTEESGAAFGRALLDYPQVINDVTGAINKIAMQVIKMDNAVNPLAKFEKGEVMPGYAVEHDFVDYLEGRDFDWCQDYISDLLAGIEDPSIVPLYYKTNYQKQYGTTIKTENMARSFYDWSGLSTIIDSITGRLEDSATDGAFETELSLFEIAYTGGYMIPVKVNAFDMTNYTEDSLKRNAAIFRATFAKFQVQSRDFNYLGVKTRTTPDSVNLLTTSDYIGANDVNVLASSFNMEKADFMGKVTALPNLGGIGSECVAIMFDDDFLQIYWNFRRMEQPFYNPANMRWNYFYNLQGIFAYCLFANCVAFVSSLKTIDSVAITASQSAKKCAYTQIDYKVTTSGTGAWSNRCVWAISGQKSAKTKISPWGRLYVAPDETATSISVTATSIQDSTKSNTQTVTITAN